MTLMRSLLLILNTLIAIVAIRNRNKEEFEVVNQINYNQYQSRELSFQLGCTLANCDTCMDNICYQCTSNRILPNCDCKLGFYLDTQSGNCLPCINGCRQCSDGTTCLTCNQQYQLDGLNQCICSQTFPNGVCNDPVNLYYTSQVGLDQQTVVITFNQIISISDINYDDTFKKSSANCKILTPEFLQVYGISSKSGNCQINISYKNQFVITIGDSFQINKLKNAPQFTLQNLLIINGLNFITPSSVQTNQSQIDIQVNSMTKQCMFSFLKIYMAYGTTGSVPLLTPYSFKSLYTEGSSSIISCSELNNPNVNRPILRCNDIDGIVFDSTTTNGSASAEFQVTCTNFFGFQTKDSVVVQFQNSASDIKAIDMNQQYVLTTYLLTTFPNLQQISSTYFYLTCQVPLASSFDLNRSQVGNQIQQSLSIYDTITQDSSYLLLVQGEYRVNNLYFSSSSSTSGSSVSTVDPSIIQTIYQLYMQTTFLVSASSSNPSGSQLDPTNALSFSFLLVDGDTSTTDLSLFNIYWYCIDSSGQICTDSNNNPVQLPQNSLSVTIPANSLQLNKKLQLVMAATRKSNIYSVQIKSINIDTSSVSLSLLSYKQLNFYYSDQVLIKLLYQNKFQTKLVVQNYLINLKYANQQALINSTSPIITFMLYDYFPNLDPSTNNKIDLDFSIYDNELKQLFQQPDLSYTISIYQPPTSCIITLSTTSSFTSNTIDLQNCQNGNYYYYQFFYYTNITQQQIEIKSQGNNITRKMLSITQTDTSIQTELPPGNLIIVVVISQINRIITNYTLPVTIAENNFSVTGYENYLAQLYSNSNLQQQNNNFQSEILFYAKIINTIEYFEPKNPTYKPSANMYSMKNSIITRLSDKVWQIQQSDIYLLSTQINLRIKQTIMSSSVNLSQTLKQQDITNIQYTLQQIQGTQLFTTVDRYYYQTYLSTTYSSLVMNANYINDWNSSNQNEIITQSTNVMNGISQIMLTNQPYVVVESQGATLHVDKLDYIKFMQIYYPNNVISLDNSNSSLTYYVQIQTWSSTHPIFSKDFSDITDPYMSQTTNTTILALLQKRFPVIIPQILTDQSTRRILLEAEANLQAPFKIGFGVVPQDEKVTCIQKSSMAGKWVANSCQMIEEFIEGQRQVSCSCATPTMTSLIADIADIFNNENVKDIFSSEGFWRVFTLQNWYEYAPLWTILGLNICFVILIRIGYRYDKSDQEMKNINCQKNSSLFLKIQNKEREKKENDSQNQDQNQLKKQDQNLINQNLDKPQAKGITKIDMHTKEQIQIQTDEQQQQYQQQQQNHEQKSLTKNNQIDTLDRQESLQSQMQTPNSRLLLETEQLDGFDLETNQGMQKQPESQTQQKTPQVNEVEAIKSSLQPNTNIQTCFHNNNEQKTSIQNYFIKTNFVQTNNPQHSQKSSELIFQMSEEKEMDTISLGFNNHLSENSNKKLQYPQVNQERIKYYEHTPSINSQQTEQIEQNELQIEVVSLDFNNHPNKNADKKLQFIQIDQDRIKYYEDTPSINSQQTEQSEQNQFIIKQSQCLVTVQDEEEGFKNNLTKIQQSQDDQIKNNQSSNQQSKIPKRKETEQNASKISIKQEKQMKKKRLEEEKVMKFQRSKEKLREYLLNEKKTKATFSFHLFLSIFIIYNMEFSRILRFLIYYNKLVWNLAINSIFGVNLSIVQTIALSVISAIALQIITTILTILCKNKKLLPLVLTIATLFDLFCYYSVLVVVSGQSSYDSNIWIAKYFLNIFIQEFVIGLAVSFGMYQICNRYFDKLINPIQFDVLQAGLLIQAFSG